MATRKPRKRKRINKHHVFLAQHRHRYDEIFEKQGGVCALCGRNPSPNRKFDLDHDHERMKIRGLLCSRCNRFLLSWMTREWLLKAADYVDREA
jgi:hypothetical protein